MILSIISNVTNGTYSYVSILHCFQDGELFLSKVTIFPTTRVLGPHSGWTETGP